MTLHFQLEHKHIYFPWMQILSDVVVAAVHTVSPALCWTHGHTNVAGWLMDTVSKTGTKNCYLELLHGSNQNLSHLCLCEGIVATSLWGEVHLCVCYVPSLNLSSPLSELASLTGRKLVETNSPLLFHSVLMYVDSAHCPSHQLPLHLSFSCPW